MRRKSEPVYRVETDKKQVALTFDIGWGENVVTPVLHELKRQKVKNATFFLSSPWVLKRPELARKIKAWGYEIGSHGNLHENYTEHSNAWIAKEVKTAEKAIRSVTGHKCRLIRTPNGDMNERVTRLLGTLGYWTIHWSVDSFDWKNPGIAEITRNATKTTKKGDIILLHASDSAKLTAKALPFIIKRLRRKGLQFVTVSQLLRDGKSF